MGSSGQKRRSLRTASSRVLLHSDVTHKLDQTTFTPHATSTIRVYSHTPSSISFSFFGASPISLRPLDLASLSFLIHCSQMFMTCNRLTSPFLLWCTVWVGTRQSVIIIYLCPKFYSTVLSPICLAPPHPFINRNSNKRCHMRLLCLAHKELLLYEARLDIGMTIILVTSHNWQLRR